MRCLAGLLLCLFSALPAFSQSEPDTEFKALLSGAQAPVSLQLKDLNETWRRLSVTRRSGAQQSGLFGGGDSNTNYYTQGHTVTLGSHTYLIAYQAQSTPLDMTALLQQSRQAPLQPPDILRLLSPPRTPETSLKLCLLDFTTVNRLTDIQPFDLKQELQAGGADVNPNTMIMAAILFPVFAQARLKARETSSVSNLKQIAIAVLMYTQDYDENFPPMSSAASAEKALLPYIKNKDVFVSPLTGEPYRPNPALSRKSLAALEKPAETVLYYEASPAQDKTRGVAFVDGHVRRIPEIEWEHLKRKSGIP
jgi:prepilin-type processing-associated H-X9-DG protein